MTAEEGHTSLQEKEQELVFLKKQVQQRDEHIDQLEQMAQQLSEELKALQVQMVNDSHQYVGGSFDRFSRQKNPQRLRKKSGNLSGGQLERRSRTQAAPA